MIGKCFFTDEIAEVSSLPNVDGSAYRTNHKCEYYLSGQARAAYNDHLTEKQRFSCLHETIKLNEQQLTPFWVVEDSDVQLSLWEKIVIRKISNFKDREITHKRKQQDILELLAKKASQLLNPFDLLNLTERERILTGIVSNQEYCRWILSLVDRGDIELSDKGKAFRQTHINGKAPFDLVAQDLSHHNDSALRLTTQGWENVYSERSLLNSRNVFIAMAFTDDTGAQLTEDHRDCIRKVLERLDWKPIIVDEVPHNDGVMDKIISSIKQSRFIVADLTYHKNGVYFEAGYAKGLGLPVILTVKKDHLDRSHFDVKHLNLIVWENHEDLKKKLAYRINATISP